MKPVCVLQHVPYEGQGYIADYLQDRGLAFDVVRLWEPYVLPDVSQCSALIVMGGPMGVYDEFPSKHDELALIKAAAGTVPMLGICLGSQLLAHALGARVYPNGKEVGYYSVQLTPEGQACPLFKGFAPDVRVLEWHGDAFDLPNDGALLATSAACRHQAFAWKNAYGILFHIEMTPAMVRGLLAIHQEWTHENFELDDATFVREADALGSLMKRQCYRLLDNFFAR